MEIIYVSSDNDLDSFEECFGTMPWLAMEGDAKGAVIKHALATKLKSFRLPTLIILNAEVGHFVTDRARKEILALEEPGEDGKEVKVDDKIFAEKGKALLQSWREREPEPIGIGNLGTLETVQCLIEYFFKNPHMAVVVVLLLAFTPIITRVMENPLLGVALFYIIKLKNFGQEKLSRNEPYSVQERKPSEDGKEKSN
jgi:Thioredoxin-like